MCLPLAHASARIVCLSFTGIHLNAPEGCTEGMAHLLIGTEPVYDADDEYRPEPEPIPEPPAWLDGRSSLCLPELLRSEPTR